MTRDYYGELIQLAASDPRAAEKLAAEFAGELLSQMDELKRQMGYVQQMLEYLNSIDPEPLKPNVRSVAPLERSRMIKDAAMFLVLEGYPSVTVHMVHDMFRQRGLDLGVRQPGSVIGTVLASAPGFKRTNIGEFEYVSGDAVPDESSYF